MPPRYEILENQSPNLLNKVPNDVFPAWIALGNGRQILSLELHPANLGKETLKIGVRGNAHGSIRIQEGEPTFPRTSGPYPDLTLQPR
jgi:hypothetical protein